jgi:alpha-glucosidase (family GH31 glycosyl hydrolase)
MSDFLRLRHQLLPYLATMNVRAHEGRPLVEPMYYEHPDEWDAYQVPNQYRFGTDLLVAPITTPADPVTGLGRVTAWLPEGEWVDVFTGLRYRGGRLLRLHRDLSSIPVLARPGTVLPLVSGDGLLAGVEPPQHVELRVVPGADGEFTLVEDRDDGRWARTRLLWDDRAGQVTVGDVEGHADTVPADRTWSTVLVGADAPGVVERVFTILDRARMGYDAKGIAYDVVRRDPSPGCLASLHALELPPGVLDAVSEVLLAH